MLASWRRSWPCVLGRQRCLRLHLQKKASHRQKARFHLLLSTSLLIGFVWATLQGDRIFHRFVSPTLTLKRDLASYVDVDPSKEKGQGFTVCSCTLQQHI